MPCSSSWTISRRARGKVYNVADDHCLTLAQIVEIIEDELGHHFEIVDMPHEVAFRRGRLEWGTLVARAFGALGLTVGLGS